jgi:hypothetical protein
LTKVHSGAYIAKQVPGFRLNFFVDEAGGFVGQDSKLMLNLQTLAETLATVCEGRAWIFVTSQADLEGVLGTFRGTKAHDLSKITARFKTQLTLASGDVREVNQLRIPKSCAEVSHIQRSKVVSTCQTRLLK